MYKEYLKRKEKIIISAIELLDEAGIQGLTTKEIAKRQGITEAAIYKQFDSKHEIVITILERFAAFDEVIMNTIIEQNMNSREGLFYFADAYAEYYQGYPEIVTVLFSFDVYKYGNATNEKMQSILGRRAEFLKGLVINGQMNGELDKNVGSEELVNIIIGLIWSLTFHWKFTNSDENLKKNINNALNWVLR